MRYEDELEMAFNGTKKLGRGMKLWIMQLKWKGQKQWKSGGSKVEYLKAKRAAKAAVYFAKKDAQAEQFPSINKNSDKNQISKYQKGCN